MVAEGWAAGRGVCFLRLPPPTSGLAALAQRGPRRGLQLDGEFSLHVSRRRLRAWPGGGSGDVRSSTPLAADLGPGPEWAAEVLLPWHGVSFSIFHSMASRREAKLCSVTGPEKVEKTTPRPLAAAPPAGLGPTPRLHLLPPLRRPRRHCLWHPPGFGWRLRPRSLRARPAGAAMATRAQPVDFLSDPRPGRGRHVLAAPRRDPANPDWPIDAWVCGSAVTRTIARLRPQEPTAAGLTLRLPGSAREPRRRVFSSSSCTESSFRSSFWPAIMENFET